MSVERGPTNAKLQAHHVLLLPSTPNAMKILLALLLLLPAMAFGQAGTHDFVTREIEWGKAVALAEFGGPDLEVGVRAREMTHVVAEIIDYTRLVPIARANVQGVIVNPVNNTAAVIASPDAKMVPMKTQIRVEKRNGTRSPDSNKEMYLLFHEPQSGIAVYFLDAIARQNHDQVVIALPKPVEETAGNTLRMRIPGSASALIPELTDWYQRLLAERRTLDTTDAVAVARFNQHAADYHSALAKMRAARDAMKLAPPGTLR